MAFFGLNTNTVAGKLGGAYYQPPPQPKQRLFANPARPASFAAGGARQILTSGGGSFGSTVRRVVGYVKNFNALGATAPASIRNQIASSKVYQDAVTYLRAHGFIVAGGLHAAPGGRTPMLTAAQTAALPPKLQAAAAAAGITPGSSAGVSSAISRPGGSSSSSAAAGGGSGPSPQADQFLRQIWADYMADLENVPSPVVPAAPGAPAAGSPAGSAGATGAPGAPGAPSSGAAGSGPRWSVVASQESDGGSGSCGPIGSGGMWYSELSTVPMGTASDFAALGKLPCMTELIISANGRSVRARKRDVGAGSSFLPVMGIYPAVAAALGLSGGQYHLVIQRTDGGNLHPVRGTPA